MGSVMADILLGLVANALRIYAIKRFVDMFVSKEEGGWRYQWAFYFVFWAETTLIYVLFFSLGFNILANILGLFLVLYPYKIHFSKKILVVGLVYGFNVLVDSIVTSSLTAYTDGQPINQIYACITSLVFLFLVIILERTMEAEKDVMLPLIYRATLAMVPIVGVAIMFYLAMNIAVTREVVIIVAAGILFMNSLIFYFYNSLARFYSERWKKTMLEQMVDVYAYQLELVYESQEKVKSLRHDMKHHIIELAGMAREEGSQEMLCYLEDMRQFILNPKEFVSTGNRNIDGVLNYLLQDADKLLESVEVKVSIPEQQFLKSFKVCVILGNLVDNAIREAAKSEEKYLVIHITTKQGLLLISVENSYAGGIVRDEERIKTSQKDLAIHGIGLENVRRVVESGNGEINIGYTESRFKVQVLLYMSSIE